MKDTPLLLLVLLSCGASSLSAQDWARGMFKVTSHDFGTVARGAKAEFAFKLENLQTEDVHIAGVRSSCGCATPRISKQKLKPSEMTEIVATYNTRSAYGAKSATITVVFDKPKLAEVQLTVSGYIRGDVVFVPGSVTFGTVEQGKDVEKRVTISYAGRTDWSISDIRSTYGHFEVQLSSPSRSDNGTTYEMKVRLKPDAPAGLVNAELLVETDDLDRSSIPLDVEALVVSPITVSPVKLSLGILTPGQSVTKQLLIRGKTPFKITGIQCEDCISANASTDSRRVHVVPIVYTAGASIGRFSHDIRVRTNLGNGLDTVCQARVTIRN